MDSVGWSAVQWEAVPRFGEELPLRALHLQEQLVSCGPRQQRWDGASAGARAEQALKAKESMLKLDLTCTDSHWREGGQNGSHVLPST